MRTLKLISLSLLICPLMAFSAPSHVTGRLLVKPKAGTDEGVLQGIFAAQGATQTNSISALDVRVLDLPEAALNGIRTALRNNPNIEFVDTDNATPPSLTPNDPNFPYQWHLTNIVAQTAWDTTNGSSTVVVGVLDTGVDGTVPDLSPNITPGTNAFDGGTNTTDVYAIYGHGTQVASIIGAVMNNAVGGAGVSGGVTLMPVRISDTNGYAYDSAVASGLVWSAARGCKVVNISYELSGSLTVSNACRYFRNAGGVVTMAAGNGGIVLTIPDNTNVLTVSGMNGNGTLATWSNRGKVIDVSAPGAGIYTVGRSNVYGAWSGTSYSAPIVAGVAALIWSVRPTATPAQVENIIMATATDMGTTGWDTSFGFGRVNAYNAVQAALTNGYATWTGWTNRTVTTTKTKITKGKK